MGCNAQCDVDRSCDLDGMVFTYEPLGFFRVLPLMDTYILLGVLVCSIADYFYELCCILTSPLGRVKIQTTSTNTQRYYTPKHLISYLSSNVFWLKFLANEL